MRVRRIAIRLAAAVAAATALSAVPALAQHEGHAAAPKVQKDHHAAGTSTEHTSGWTALDAYHEVMMGAWHPAKEKGDVAPARVRADSLAMRADAWAAADVPKACDSPETRAAVAKVRDDSRAFATLAKTGTDADVKVALKALHDRFEVVNRGCKVHAAH